MSFTSLRSWLRAVFDRRVCWAAALAAGAAIAAVCLLWHDPEQNVWAPQCWFYRWTGLKCPGCGTQRALYHLLHLRIGAAFRYNPLLFAVLPYLGMTVWLEYCGGRERHPVLYRRMLGSRGLKIAVAVLVAYWIGRNAAGF